MHMRVSAGALPTPLPGPSFGIANVGVFTRLVHLEDLAMYLLPVAGGQGSKKLMRGQAGFRIL